MLEQEINEFGRRLGLPGLELSAEGLAALDIENVGKLTLERGEGDAEGGHSDGARTRRGA